MIIYWIALTIKKTSSIMIVSSYAIMDKITEKLVNDKSNICNYNVIEELNVFDGVYDSNIKTS